MKTTHTMIVEVEVRFTPSGCTEMEASYPTLSIEFSYTPGRPAYTPRGEYAPIDPPEGAEVAAISATIVENPDGILPPDWLRESERQEMILEWARNYLETEHGYDTACEFAEDQR